MNARMVAVLLLLSTSGCSITTSEVTLPEEETPTDEGEPSAPEGEELFEANGDPTDDSLYGIWKGTIEGVDETSGTKMTFEMRPRFGKDEVRQAARCSANGRESPIAAVVVKARVSETELSVLETKSDTRTGSGIRCSAGTKTTKLTACDDDVKVQCFERSGTKLTFYELGQETVFTKVAD